MNRRNVFINTDADDEHLDNNYAGNGNNKHHYDKENGGSSNHYGGNAGQNDNGYVPYKSEARDRSPDATKNYNSAKNTSYYKKCKQGYNTEQEHQHDEDGGSHGNDLTDARAQQVLKRMVRCNTLTIGAQKAPEYYLKLIRYHFIKSDEPMLSLQSLGMSCQNLVYVACLVTMKGYATYKRIKNDHLSVPIADSKTGAHIGLVKKVRLTVKLIKAENFSQIIREEEKKEGGRSGTTYSGGNTYTSTKRAVYKTESTGRYNSHIEKTTAKASSSKFDDSGKNSLSKTATTGNDEDVQAKVRDEEEEKQLNVTAASHSRDEGLAEILEEDFDQEDLILKTKEEIEEMEEQPIYMDEEEAKRYTDFEIDPNFVIREEIDDDDSEAEVSEDEDHNTNIEVGLEDHEVHADCKETPDDHQMLNVKMDLGGDGSDLEANFHSVNQSHDDEEERKTPSNNKDQIKSERYLMSQHDHNQSQLERDNLNVDHLSFLLEQVNLNSTDSHHNQILSQTAQPIIESGNSTQVSMRSLEDPEQEINFGTELM
eukprot:403346590